MRTKASDELAKKLTEHGAMSRLAERLGVNPSMVSRWASGERSPRMTTLALIERETGISPGHWVIPADDEPDTADDSPAAKRKSDPPPKRAAGASR